MSECYIEVSNCNSASNLIYYYKMYGWNGSFLNSYAELGIYVNYK